MKQENINPISSPKLETQIEYFDPEQNLESYKDQTKIIYQLIARQDRANADGKVPWEEEPDPRDNLFPIEVEMRKKVLDSAGAYLPEKEVERLKRAIALAIFAHADKYRVSNKPYSTHLLGTASKLTKWKMDEEIVSAAVLHDTLEDTWLTDAQIRKLMSPKIAEYVSTVSKYEGRIQRKDITEKLTQLQVIYSLSQHPGAAVLKLADRLSNLEDVEVLGRKKSLSIIKETEDVYAPFADVTGEHEIAEQLRMVCLRIRDPRKWKQKLKDIRSLNHQLTGFENKLKDPAPEQEGKTPTKTEHPVFDNFVLSMLKKHGIEFVHVETSGPLFRDFYRKGPALHINIAVDVHSEDIPEWGEMAIKIANAFFWDEAFSHNFPISPDSVSKNISQGLEDSVTFWTALDADGSAPVAVTIYPRDTYKLENTPLSDMFIPETEENTLRIQKAKFKHYLLTQRLKTISKGEWTEQEAAHLLAKLAPRSPEGNLWVIGKDKKGVEEFWNIREGTTALEYAVSIAPTNWFKAINFFVNDKQVPASYELEPYDTIHIIFSNEEKWDPSWVYSFPEGSKGRNTVQRHLLEKLKNTEDKKLERSLKENGLKRLEKGVSPELRPIYIKPGNIIGKIHTILNDPEMTEDDFLIKVGLGQIKPDKIELIAKKLAEENRKVGIIDIFFEPDAPGQQSVISNFLAGNKINLLASAAETHGSSSHIKVLLDPSDADKLERLKTEMLENEACKTVNIKEVRVCLNEAN